MVDKLKKNSDFMIDTVKLKSEYLSDSLSISEEKNELDNKENIEGKNELDNKENIEGKNELDNKENIEEKNELDNKENIKGKNEFDNKENIEKKKISKEEAIREYEYVKKKNKKKYYQDQNFKTHVVNISYSTLGLKKFCDDLDSSYIVISLNELHELPTFIKIFKNYDVCNLHWFNTRFATRKFKQNLQWIARGSGFEIYLKAKPWICSCIKYKIHYFPVIECYKCWEKVYYHGCPVRNYH